MRRHTQIAARLGLGVSMLFGLGGARQPETPGETDGSSTKSPAETRSKDALTKEFAERLAALDAKMAKIADLRADFEQTKQTAMLKKPLVSSGSLVCKGEAVLWRTVSPRKSDMLVKDAKVTVYYPQDKLAEEYPMGSRFRDAAGGPLPRLSKLTENFDFTEIDAKEFGEESGSEGHRIAVKLTPKTDELKKHVESVRVLIDERVPCADRIVITDPEGERTQIRFTAVRINTGVKDSELELKMPKDTKISTPTQSPK
ncbi:MAG: outer membrane lipoprotein carrier protein LolA [Planctomycetes bacterium]|nr:outer membrane lipoprotein carrier protein LolA [Planctomycetota bacterium]